MHSHMATMQVHALLTVCLKEEINVLQDEFAKNESFISNTRSEIDAISQDPAQAYSMQVLTKILQDYVSKNISILEKISQLQTTLQRYHRKRSCSNDPDEPEASKVSKTTKTSNESKESKEPKEPKESNKSEEARQQKASNYREVIVIDEFTYKPMRFVYDKYNRLIAEYVPDTLLPHSKHELLDIYTRQLRSMVMTCTIDDLRAEIHSYIQTFTKARLDNMFENASEVEIVFSQAADRSTNSFPYVYNNNDLRVDIHLDKVFNAEYLFSAKEHDKWLEHFYRNGYKMKINYNKWSHPKHVSLTIVKRNSRKYDKSMTEEKVNKDAPIIP